MSESQLPSRTGSVVDVDDEIEALRVLEDLNYAKNRAALGKPSLDLIADYLTLYEHLWNIGAQWMPREPIRQDALFTHQMLLECRADLVRTMLLMLRTHLTEAHGQTRRAIECCGWARRVHEKPELVTDWLATDNMELPPSPEWKKNITAKLLFPADHPKMVQLRKRYQVTSRCVHPFRFSFVGRTSVQEDADGTVSVLYRFFDPDDIRQYLPARFLWTLQTHDLIIDVFEEILAHEIEQDQQAWAAHRRAVGEAQTKVGKMWIEVTKRADEREKGAKP